MQEEPYIGNDADGLHRAPIAQFGDDGRVYVTDFGAVSPSGGRERLVGVPEYVSPEQARGGETLPASDIYSLGVLMYHMLCGHPPFAESSPRETLNAHISAKVPPMNKSSRKAHPALCKLVMRLLTKNPEDRPSAETAYSALCTTSSYLRPELVKPSAKVDRPAGWGRKIAAALIAPVVLACLATGAMIYHSLKTENAIDSLVKEKSTVTKSIAETEKKKRIRAEYVREFTQGKKFYEKGQYGLAEESFKRASHLQPKFTDPRMFLSAIYINREEYDKAAWHLRRIIRMNPRKREAQDALRFVEARLGASPVELSRP
jgi:serine/threonine protein kinase